MTVKPIKILLIDSNPDDVSEIKETFSNSQTDQFECIHIDRLSEGLESLVYHVFDIILLDLSPPDDNVFDTLITILRTSPDIPVITMSRTQDDDSAARARREGAYNHLVKGDSDHDLLKRSVLAAVKQKQNENQLIRAPDTWERTFNAIPDLIMILDSEHRIIRANKAMAEKLGRALEELIGRHCYHTVHGAEEPPHFCPHVRLMSDGLEHSAEVYEDLLGGDFLVSVTPLYDTEGTIIGSVHVARDITEIKRTEHALLEKAHDLGERVKELNCLFEISKLREEEGHELGETLQNIVDAVPPAWQYPEITSARMTLDEKEFITENFNKSIWKQSCDIIVHGKRVGSLEVYYSKEKPDRDEGPFLKEERRLLTAICERIGRFIEHKGAEDALREAHDKLEQLVRDRTAALDSEHALRKTIEESIISGIAAFDLEGRQTYVNNAFCKMVGWSKDELIGAEPPFAYWPPEEMEKIKEAFQTTLHGKIPPGGFELILQRRTGERFYTLILVSPLKDTEGSVMGWVASVGDITSRKKAEESLRKSEMSLAEAQRIAHIGNWDWTIQTNELRWSDEIYRIFRLTPQEFGATYEAFLSTVHPDDREFVKRSVNEALYGMPYSIDHRIVLPDGTIRFVHEQGEVTFGESGEPVRMLGTVQDITERKEAEKALQDSKAKYAAVVEGFDGFVYIYSEHHDIEFMNERMIKHIGHDAVGQKCTLALKPLGDICPWCKDNMVLGNETVRLEIHNQADNRWYYIINTPIHNQDKTTSRMVMIQDITEKKENEARLIMSERLSALGQMASGIAHEINNPLATISACAEGLLNRIQKGRSDPEVFEDYLHIIHEEVARCKNITTGMLSFVREKTYEKKQVDVNTMLDKTLELISFQGRLKKVEVIRNYNDSPVVHGSDGALKQVFLSIIMNALDAMEDKGTITLETGTEEREAFVKISDTGTGISTEDASKVFDPFFTTKSEKGGIGLGLSIANKIIIDNNGRIQVDSEKEKGTTFTITLPAVQSGNMPDAKGKVPDI
jgi:PAS domain S-box-containing protein